MISSFINMIETSSSGSYDQRLETINKILEALNCVTESYSACGENADEVINQCELDKETACWDC